MPKKKKEDCFFFFFLKKSLNKLYQSSTLGVVANVYGKLMEVGGKKIKACVGKFCLLLQDFVHFYQFGVIGMIEGSFYVKMSKI